MKNAAAQQPDVYVGRVVKRCFPVRSRPDDAACGHVAAEHMWVDVVAVDEGQLVGELLNHPHCDVGYKFGDVVRFPPSEVERVDDGAANRTRVH